MIQWSGSVAKIIISSVWYYNSHFCVSSSPWWDWLTFRIVKIFTDLVTKLDFLQRNLDIYAHIVEEELLVVTNAVGENIINSNRKMAEAKTTRRDFFVFIIFSSFIVFFKKYRLNNLVVQRIYKTFHFILLPIKIDSPSLFNWCF